MTVLLLMTANTYRARPFAAAARRVGLDILWGVDTPEELADTAGVPLAVDFRRPDSAVETIVDCAQRRPLQAILALDDAASLIAARASLALGLPHNDPDAALAARDKLTMRRALQAGGVPCPHFEAFALDSDPAALAATVRYPCVLKPLLLNGSRGVIRANDEQEFVAAWKQVLTVIQKSIGDRILVEDYLPGVEVALEGLLESDGLRVLALFDKPDPLEGPYFEETIYVTPSRLPQTIQRAVAATTQQAATALGLRTGPVHAELRINEAGVWIVEIAGRSIGGLCSATLQFGPTNASLEELVLRQAAGLPIESWEREHAARGVMMIPIPTRGLLRGVHGVEAAEAVAGIESIEITARLNYPVTPLPEGESYLGFIFAHGDEPAHAERALREAHALLEFEIEPEIGLIPVSRLQNEL